MGWSMAQRTRYATWESEKVEASSSQGGGARSIRIFGFAACLLLACAAPVLFSELAIGTSEQPQLGASAEALVTESTVSILVPRVPIKAGEGLVAVQFRRVMVPKDSSRARALSDPAVLVGMQARRDLYPEIPLMGEDIRPANSPNQVIAHIPEGFRAVSLAVSSTSAVEGWAGPGANVDVVMIAKHNGVDTSNVLARNVEVLSIDRKSSADAHSTAAVPATITLLLRKSEAPRVALAARVGSIVLHLRGWKERHLGGPSQIVVKDLLRSKKVQPFSPLPSNEALSAPRL